MNDFENIRYYKDAALSIIKDFCQKYDENFEMVKKELEEMTNDKFHASSLSWYIEFYNLCKNNLYL